MGDFAERLRRHDGTADDLEWPPGLPRHALACDVLEHALLLNGSADCLAAVREIRAHLDQPSMLNAVADRMWDLVPHRGAYPGVSGEPTWETLPAWAAASLASDQLYSDVFFDSVRIAARAVCDAAKDAVLAVAWQRKVPDAPAIAWQAALELPRKCGILPHHADAERTRILGAPPSGEAWQEELELRAWEAERVWQNWFVASKL